MQTKDWITQTHVFGKGSQSQILHWFQCKGSAARAQTWKTDVSWSKTTVRWQIHFNTEKIRKQYWLVPFKSTIRPSCTWSWISCNVLSNISPALACSTVYGSLGYRNKASKSFGERGRLIDNLKKTVSVHRSYNSTTENIQQHD